MQYTLQFIEAAKTVLPADRVDFLVERVVKSKRFTAPTFAFQPEHMYVLHSVMSEMRDRLAPRMRGYQNHSDSRYLCHLLSSSVEYHEGDERRLSETAKRFTAAECTKVRQRIKKCMGAQGGCGMDVFFDYERPADTKPEQSKAERIFVDALYRSLLIDPAL